MDKETLELINRPYVFREFPKMLYHPDGRQTIAENEGAQSALGAEWTPTPETALKARNARDAADAARQARRIGAEAAARGVAPEH